ncbi:MAG: hypothetical protein OXR64_09575 [Chloroflexota bacterium]|nr:hypothetical protein [Chloroflexota bacterium]MDE2920084.1 hypothetical protein [Chloroflexota bacterium]
MTGAVLLLAVLALLAPSLVTSAAPVLGVVTPRGHEGHDHIHLPWELPAADADGADGTSGEFPEQSSPFPVGVIPALLAVVLVVCMLERVGLGFRRVRLSSIGPPLPPPRPALR